MRSVVLIHGVLQGMGHVSNCEMVAMRDTGAPGGRPSYSRCSVIEAAPNLPDGEYVVSFSSCEVRVWRESGLWLPDGTTASRAA